MKREDKSPRLAEAQIRIPPDHGWRRLPLVAGAAGILGLGASALLGLGHPEQFFFSWLVAFLYFLSLALGGLVFVLIHWVTKARWSVVVRRLAENVMATLPLFVLLFLPLLAGLHELYHWSHAEASADHLLRAKQGWLNVPFFVVRAAVYLLAWSGLALWFLRGSERQDRGDPTITARLIRTSAPGLVVFAVTISFAAIDWIMSLDPHWYSTMFGVYWFSGCLVGIFGLLILLAAAMRGAGLLRDVITVEHFHDLGKLLFGFTVFWAYIAFSQYFLIWYANIPEETTFYLRRGVGSWLEVSMLLGWGHFLVPFFFLMPRTIKRRTGFLVAGAVWMLAVHLVDVHWLVMPLLHEDGFRPTLLDLTTLVGIGGLFVAALGWHQRRHALIPVGDPLLDESLRFENV